MVSAATDECEECELVLGFISFSLRARLGRAIDAHIPRLWGLVYKIGEQSSRNLKSHMWQEHVLTIWKSKDEPYGQVPRPNKDCK